MTGIAYGQGTAPNLPPVNLPAFDDGSQQPTRIVISGPSGNQATGSGGWAPYNAPAPTPAQGAPDQTQQQPQQQPAANAALDQSGGWAPYQPAKSQPAPQPVSGGEAATAGLANGLTFGFAPAIAGLANAAGQPGQQVEDQQTQAEQTMPAGAEAMGGAAIAQPFIGAARMIGNMFSDHPDPTVRQAYDQGRQDALTKQTAAQQQHPWLYGAGQVAGSLALPIGGDLAAAGSLGRVGKSVVSGAIGGGLYGAGDTTSEGGSPLDVLESAGGGAVAGGTLGGALGGSLETVGNIAGKVSSIVRGARDTDAEAGSKVLHAFHGDAPQVTKALGDTEAMNAGREAGTPIYPVDFGGENTRALMRSAANTSPTARNLINEKLDSRYKQQADRFSGWIKSKFGGGDRDRDLEFIKQEARKQNAPAYRKAYAEGDREIWTPELERLTAAPYIESALRKAISKWKNYAVRDGFGAMNPPFRVEKGGLIRTGGKGMPAYPNIQLWDYAARELQDRAREAAPGSEQAKLYNDLARMLKDELDKQVPAYKAAREGAAVFFKARDAAEAGAQFVSDSSITNQAAARAVANMKPAERELFSRGFASRLSEQIERSGYRSDVLNNMFVSSPRAIQRIKIALGEDGAREFEALMRVEGLVNKARQALGNSTTVRQGHEAGLAAGAVGILETLHGVLNPAYIIGGAIVVGGRAAAKHVDDRVAIRVAEMLFSHRPAEIARGYKIISRSPVMRDALRRASDIGVRQIVNNFRPSGVAAAALTMGDHLLSHPEHAPEYPPDNYYGDQGAGNPSP